MTQGVAAARLTGPVAAGEGSNGSVKLLSLALGALLVLTIPVLLVAAIRHGLRRE